MEGFRPFTDLYEGQPTTKPEGRIAGAAIHRRLIKEGEHAVIIGLGQRVEFVIVAASAHQGKAEPGRGGGLAHIHHVVHAVLFGDASPFAIDGMITAKGRRELLFFGGVRQEVAGELPDGEFIVRQIAVESLDDPIAPRPHRSFGVTLIAV